MSTPVVLPRVIIVSRRTLRKNKFVDFVGEYHLDLIVGHGAAPVIVPRVAGIHTLLQSFEPIHGVLLCEGEDIDPSLYKDEETSLSNEELEEIQRLHASDTAIDKEKDTIELSLARICIERNIPYLGICRGSQVLNVACGGTLYQDIEKEVARFCSQEKKVVHMDYGNYDGHRHAVRIVDETPLHQWFEESFKDDHMEILVNSYHHQGVKRLAQRFKPMAFAPDGLVEGFYDPDAYDPEEGKFMMGLQFHPERMRKSDSDEFDYPGCTAAYKEFVKAVVAYQKKLNSSTKSDSALSLHQENRLMQMGPTVRNASSYMGSWKLNEKREKLTRVVMEKMTVKQLSELNLFYQMMGQICSEMLENKQKQQLQNVSVDLL